MELKIDPEFQRLIRPLTDEEFSRLRQNILDDGEVNEPIITWNGIILDGHNRWRIIQENPGIPWYHKELIFFSREDAIIWICRNQLGRRNLTDFQRVELVRVMEDTVKAKARERMSPGTNQYTERSREKFPQTSQGKATDELGAMAGVSGKTYSHAAAVIESAPAPVVDAARNNDLSINAAYEVTRMEPQAQQEIAERIEQGEKPKAVVSEVKKREKKPPKPKPAAKPEPEDFSKCQTDTLKRETPEPDPEPEETPPKESEPKPEPPKPAKPEYTVDKLIEEITLNSDGLVNFLRRILSERNSCYQDADSKRRVLETVEKSVSKIQEIGALLK